MLEFLTGASSIPAVGFGSQINVIFLHGCPAECRCKPTISTCDLTMRLPVHIKSSEEMTAYFNDSLRMSYGFGRV